VFYVDF